MGFLGSSFAFTQYRVDEKCLLLPPSGQGCVTFEDRLAEVLCLGAFQSIDDLPYETETIGWVNTREAGTGQPIMSRADICVGPADEWLLFTLRRDTRTLPGKKVQEELAKELEGWRARFPGRKKPSVQDKAMMKEQVTRRLMPKVLPKQQTWDIAWDRSNKIMLISSVNQKHLDIVEDMLYNDLPGLRLTPMIPLAEAIKLNPACAVLNRTTAEETFTFMHENAWFGREIFLWLTYWNSNGGGKFRGGHGALPSSIDGEPGYTLYYNDHCLLTQPESDCTKRTTLVGPVAENYDELRVGLHAGMSIDTIKLALEIEEELYSFKLDSLCFGFSSVQVPKTILDASDKTGDARELFAYLAMDRFAYIQRLRGLLKDALTQYLSLRCSAPWQEWSKAMDLWVESVSAPRRLKD